MACSYMGLLGDASFRPGQGLVDGVKQMCSHNTSKKLQQPGGKSRYPCNRGKIIYPVCWSLIWIWWGRGLNVDGRAIGWRWGTTNVGLGITYICFVPIWFPVIRMGQKYTHKKSMPKILFENRPKIWKTMQVYTLNGSRTTNIDKAGNGLQSGFCLLSQPLWHSAK